MTKNLSKFLLFGEGTFEFGVFFNDSFNFASYNKDAENFWVKIQKVSLFSSHNVLYQFNVLLMKYKISTEKLGVLKVLGVIKNS